MTLHEFTKWLGSEVLFCLYTYFFHIKVNRLCYLKEATASLKK